MIPLAPHITAFLQQRLPIERRASPNTCDSYAHAFPRRSPGMTHPCSNEATHFGNAA